MYVINPVGIYQITYILWNGLPPFPPNRHSDELIVDNVLTCNKTHKFIFL